MDPQTTLTEMLDALVERDYESAIEYAGNLNGWIGRGGFQPDYQKAVWALFERVPTVPSQAEPNRQRKARIPMPKTKTVDVRIAVAVCSLGHWTSAGHNGMVSYDYLWDGLDCVCSGPGKEHLVWVTATVPIPTIQTVKGHAEKTEKPDE